MMCARCKQKNNISHFFVDFDRVKPFWISLGHWLNTIEVKDITLTTKDIIFGLHSLLHVQYNFCILHAKWWIHINREQDQKLNLNFCHFRVYLKGIIAIEKQIAANKNKLDIFKQHFEMLEMSL